MPWPTLREQRRPKRRVRLIEMTDEEVQYNELSELIGLLLCSDEWCQENARARCSHVFRGSAPCVHAWCRAHAHWVNGKPYCAWHTREQ